MGVFGKLFSKKADPELERVAQSIKDACAEIQKPQGPQGLAKSAAKGAKVRRCFFELLEEFEAEIGRIGMFVAADGVFSHPQLIEWFQKEYGFGEPKLILETLIVLVSPAAAAKRKIDEDWPTIVAAYHGKPNTEDILLDKADKLAQYIIPHLGIAIDVYSWSKDNHELSEDQEELAKLEESAVWFSTINHMANWSIRRECPLFMEYLEDAFGYHLALRGAPPDAIDNTVVDRVNEYGSYKWNSEGEEPPLGTLLWEAGKHLMDALGLGRGVVFQLQFEELFLVTVKEALVFELLTGRSASKK